MTPATDNLFKTVYRNFKRINPQCNNIDILCSVLNCEAGDHNYSVNPAIVRASVDLPGFCVVYNGCRGFIPETSSLSQYAPLLNKIGDALNLAEIILPSYFSMEIIGPMRRMIQDTADPESQLVQGDQALCAMLTPECLSIIVTEHYPRYAALASCHVQIRETAELYCLGLYRSAITTLLPCVERAVRELRSRIGIDDQNNISVKYLTNIYEEWLRYYIDKYIFRNYDWVMPAVKSKLFFSRFDRFFQIAANGKAYFSNHLYKDSRFDSGISGLNRHSILHGFMTQYHGRGNYLRLINFMNNICFMLSIAGDHSVNFLPEKTQRSENFLRNLHFLEGVGAIRARTLDEWGIER